jgi:hypothetical protein
LYAFLAALPPHGLCPRTWNRAPTRERQRTGHALIKNIIIITLIKDRNLENILFNY